MDAAVGMMQHVEPAEPLVDPLEQRGDPFAGRCSSEIRGTRMALGHRSNQEPMAAAFDPRWLSIAASAMARAATPSSYPTNGFAPSNMSAK